ncbi:hypothetical protein GCM10020000_07720 [Streptomyces olivoverticillatus]
MRLWRRPVRSGAAVASSGRWPPWRCWGSVNWSVSGCASPWTGRVRSAADWAFQASDASFPSGHATTSALAAGLLAWAVLRVAPRIAGRVAAACCGLWAVTVAATRVFLGVHWPSDIVAGWLLATAWLAVTLPALSWWAGRKPVRARGPPHRLIVSPRPLP